MGPLFDSSASALRFALNHRDDEAKPAAPIMNTVLYAAQHRTTKDKAEAPLIRRAVPLGELDRLEKTLQAGIILNFLQALSDNERHTLVARYRNAHMVCNCSNPCCSGFRTDRDWRSSIDALAELLHVRAAEDRSFGLVSFKTAPPLMTRLLERMFNPRFRYSMKDIAEVCGVHENTVVKHGKYLGGILDNWKADGLTSMDAILVHEGIVGALE